jgi:hypothetical protein
MPSVPGNVRGRYRMDVKNEDVLVDLAKGLSVYHIAQKNQCAQIVIQRIRAGTRRETATPAVLARLAAVKRSKRPACSCCGQRPVARGKGLRLLCLTCYSNPPDGQDDDLPINLAVTAEAELVLYQTTLCDTIRQITYTSEL